MQIYGQKHEGCTGCKRQTAEIKGGRDANEYGKAEKHAFEKMRADNFKVE